MDSHAVAIDFTAEIQRALQLLYKPAELNESVLVKVFGLQARHNPYLALCDILTTAIRALKPASHIPSDAEVWRIYQILVCRYLERIQQKQVAADMGFSIRQLRRAEKTAVHVLSSYLWTHYALAASWHTHASEPVVAVQAEALSLPVTGLPGQEQELAWMRASLPSAHTDLGNIIHVVLKRIGPIAQANRVEMSCQIAENAPMVSGQLALLSQALLDLMTVAVQVAHGGTVYILLLQEDSRLKIQIGACARTPPHDFHDENDEDWEDNLRMAQQLIGYFGGELEVSIAKGRPEPFLANLRLDGVEQTPVLIVDDNADVLHLFERYLAGTHYRFVGTRDPERALALAVEFTPVAIMLDVMLPGVDGWELLGRLREHPSTSNIPVIVTTILPQEQVALALGAAGFIRKPVSRELFLQLLDRFAAQQRT